MFWPVILVFLTLLSNAASKIVDVVPLNRYSRVSKRIESVIKKSNNRRRLQQERSFCGVFEGQDLDDDPLLVGIECNCTDDIMSFSIYCEAQNTCIKHTKGQMSSYTGDLFFQFEGNFENPINPIYFDSICFDFNNNIDLSTVCLYNPLLREDCSISIGQDFTCPSCTVCDDNGSINFDCGDYGQANGCAGDQLEGTPIQFFSTDIKSCEEEEEESPSSSNCDDRNDQIFHVDTEAGFENCEWLANNYIRYNYLCRFVDVAYKCKTTCDTCGYFIESCG